MAYLSQLVLLTRWRDGLFSNFLVSSLSLWLKKLPIPNILIKQINPLSPSAPLLGINIPLVNSSNPHNIILESVACDKANPPTPNSSWLTLRDIIWSLQQGSEWYWKWSQIGRDTGKGEIVLICAPLNMHVPPQLRRSIPRNWIHRISGSKCRLLLQRVEGEWRNRKSLWRNFFAPALSPGNVFLYLPKEKRIDP